MKKRLLLPILGLSVLLASCGGSNTTEKTNTTKGDKVVTTTKKAPAHEKAEYSLTVCEGGKQEAGGIVSNLTGDSSTRINGQSVNMDYSAYIENKTEEDMSFVIKDLTLSNIDTKDTFTGFTVTNKGVTYTKNSTFTVLKGEWITFNFVCSFVDENKNGSANYEYTLVLENNLGDVYTITIGRFPEIYKYTEKEDVTLYLDSDFTQNGISYKVEGEYDTTFEEHENFDMNISITNNTTDSFNIYMLSNEDLYSLENDSKLSSRSMVDFTMDDDRVRFYDDEIKSDPVVLKKDKTIVIEEEIIYYHGDYPFYAYHYLYDTTNKKIYKIKLIYTLANAQ